MMVPPLKRERTESSRGRLNIRVAITEFYCDRPGRFAGLFVAGSKSESPSKAGPSFDGLVRLWGDLKHASCGAPKGSACGFDGPFNDADPLRLADDLRNFSLSFR